MPDLLDFMRQTGVPINGEDDASPSPNRNAAPVQDDLDYEPGPADTLTQFMRRTGVPVNLRQAAPQPNADERMQPYREFWQQGQGQRDIRNQAGFDVQQQQPQTEDQYIAAMRGGDHNRPAATITPQQEQDLRQQFRRLRAAGNPQAGEVSGGNSSSEFRQGFFDTIFGRGQPGSDWSLRQIPFLGTAADIGDSIENNLAEQRLRAGQDTPADRNLMAQREARQGETARQHESLEGKLWNMAGGTARFLGEASVLPSGGGFAGTVGRTAALPSMWAPEAIDANTRAGRDWNDWRGMPKPFVEALITNYIFEGAPISNRLAGSIPQAGAVGVLGRGAARVAGLAAESQLAHAATSILGNAEQAVARAAGAEVPEWLQLDTGFGTVGALVRGERGAFRNLVGELMTFVIYSAMHASADAQHAAMRRGGIDPATGQPAAAPESPRGTPPARPAPEVDDLPADVSEGLRQAFVGYMDSEAEAGRSRGVASHQALEIIDALRRRQQSHPDETREQRRQQLEGIPDDGLRRLAEAVIESMPEPEARPAPAAAPAAEQRTEQPAEEAGPTRDIPEQATGPTRDQATATPAPPEAAPPQAAPAPEATAQTAAPGPPAPRRDLLARARDRAGFGQAVAQPTQEPRATYLRDVTPGRDLWERVLGYRDSLGGGNVRRVTIDDLKSVGGLNDREAYVLLQRMSGRTHDDIAREPKLLMTRQRIQQIEHEAVTKLLVASGEHPDIAKLVAASVADIHESTSPEEARSATREVEYQERREPVTPKPRSLDEARSDALDKLGEFIASDKPKASIDGIREAVGELVRFAREAGIDSARYLAESFPKVDNESIRLIIDNAIEESHAESATNAGRGGRGEASVRRAAQQRVHEEAPVHSRAPAGPGDAPGQQDAAVSGRTGGSEAGRHELNYLRPSLAELPKNVVDHIAASVRIGNQYAIKETQKALATVIGETAAKEAIAEVRRQVGKPNRDAHPTFQGVDPEAVAEMRRLVKSRMQPGAALETIERQYDRAKAWDVLDAVRNQEGLVAASQLNKRGEPAKIEAQGRRHFEAEWIKSEFAQVDNALREASREVPESRREEVIRAGKADGVSQEQAQVARQSTSGAAEAHPAVGDAFEGEWPHGDVAFDFAASPSARGAQGQPIAGSGGSGTAGAGGTAGAAGRGERRVAFESSPERSEDGKRYGGAGVDVTVDGKTVGHADVSREGRRMAQGLSDRISKKFGIAVDPERIFRIQSIELDPAARGQKLGQKLTIAAMGQFPDATYYNSQAYPEQHRVLLALKNKGLIELHKWEPTSPDDDIGPHIKTLTDKGRRAAELLRGDTGLDLPRTTRSMRLTVPVEEALALAKKHYQDRVSAAAGSGADLRNYSQLSQREADRSYAYLEKSRSDPQRLAEKLQGPAEYSHDIASLIEPAETVEFPPHDLQASPRGWASIGPAEPQYTEGYVPQAAPLGKTSDLSPDHAAVSAFFGKALKDSGLTKEQIRTHADNLKVVLNNMTPAEAATLSKRLADTHFAKDVRALNEWLAPQSRTVQKVHAEGRSVGGAVGWASEGKDAATLAIDGDTASRHSQQLYGHELMHVIDGRDHAASSTPAFKAIYDRDFAAGQFGDHAASSPAEALAKIGEMLYTGTSMAELEKRFPGVTEALKPFGITGSGKAAFKKPAEVFSSSVDDGNLHVDILKDAKFDLSAEPAKAKPKDDDLRAAFDRAYAMREKEPAKPSSDSLAQSFLDEWNKAGGGMFPKLTRLSREAGEKAARYVNAAFYGRSKGAELIDRVLGKNATESQHTQAGGLVFEMRREYAEAAFRRKAGEETAAAADLRKQMERFTPGSPSEQSLAEKAKAAEALAKDWTKKAEDARDATIIGRDGSPFESRADLDSFRDSADGQRIIDAFKKHVVPQSNEIYAMGKGLDPEADSFDSLTQMREMPVNIKRITAEEASGEAQPGMVRFGGGRGNLRNVLSRAPGLTKAATFSAEHGYDVHLGRMIEHLMGQYKDAAKTDLINSMVRHDIGALGKPGDRTKFFRGVKGAEFDTKRSGPNMTLHVDPRVAGEFREALEVDKPLGEGMKALKSMGQILTASSTLGAGEPTAHLRNMATMLFRPRMIRGLIAAVKMGADARGDRLVELAKIGAAKEHGFDATKFDRMASQVTGASAINYAQRAVEAVSKLPPFSWTSKVIEHADHMMRLGADKAFDSLAKDGAVDTETNRRNFINQLGQYNKAAQARLVVALRDLGINPFATASGNFYVQGIRSLTMNPGVEAKTWGTQAKFRREQFTKSFLFLAGGVAAVNYALWGSMFGDDQTPLGAVKLGKLPDGRTRYFDVGGMTGITRGLRQTGLSAAFDAARGGGDGSHTLDAAAHQAASAPVHMLTGPAVNTLSTLAFGKDAQGHELAGRVRPTDTGLAASQTARNIGAAAAHANPITGTIADRFMHDEPPSGEETAARLLGALGPRYSSKRAGLRQR